MLNYNIVLKMLEKVKNHKYRDDLYEDTVLKRGLDINLKDSNSDVASSMSLSMCFRGFWKKARQISADIPF